jgi:hypothetical protein
VQRQVVVEGITANHPCPVNYAVENNPHLIDQDVTGGPWRLATNIEALRRGIYVFCAWADPTQDSGTEPQASTELTVHIGTPPSPARPHAHKRRRHERPATRAERRTISRLLAATERSLHVHVDWVKVSTRGPFALVYLSGPGQVSAIVLRGSGRQWRGLAVISDEGLRCGLVPPAVVVELHLEKYNEGPKPCS